ncbi:hypothetical protein [Pseudohongiella spirulinae]|uniref:Uncharacterized protein n=1 Tax=Pseudohongiella spirulinae TaxID=1249552 RepID=A0A0S2KBG9_9GAMM|nr:hypothetical protein [Pseudohongiella spirulinae]ALO45665.1 hypothetical protein PS2015_996 [Pseudohongiella spirulinae]
MQKPVNQSSPETSAHREQCRRQLLAEMGIHCLFARRRLPGAGPSHPQIFLPLQASDEIGVKARPVSADLSSAGPVVKAEALSMTRQILQETEEAVSEAPQPVKPPAVGHTDRADNDADVAESHQSDSQEQEAFAFSWFTLDYRLAVLVMLPAGQPRLSGSSRDMLQKILAALSQDYRTLRLNEHNFHWPLPDDLGLPADRDAARHTVRGFIARRMREQTVANVLVLSEQPPFFLGGQEESQVAGLYTDEQFGFSVLCTHALHSMQEQPALKRTAWKAMQILIPRL